MALHGYGWRPQAPDHRDYTYTPHDRVLNNLPPTVDLSPAMGPVFNQGKLGTCGPNAVDSLILFDQHTESLPIASVARLFIYYTTRQLMGTLGQDSGVDNRTMLRALNQFGFCDEQLCPYVVSAYNQPPSDAATAAAQANRITSYAAVAQDLATMQGTLASGFPFVFGFTAYESLESPAVAQSGILPMPHPSERVIGGHDVAIVGYDTGKQMFKAKNSWSDRWGQGGYFWIPFAYATNPNLASDFWVINAIPGGIPSPAPSPAPGPAPSPIPTPSPVHGPGLAAIELCDQDVFDKLQRTFARVPGASAALGAAEAMLLVEHARLFGSAA